MNENLSIRKMNNEDLNEIRRLLFLESYNLDKDMMPSNTFIWDENGIRGFFYFVIEQNIPVLRNFLIKKEFRNLNNARFLIKEYIKIIKSLGFKVSFISVKKDYLRKLIKYYFRRLPYSHEEFGYLVEV